MKKKLLALGLCLCTVFSAVACGDEEAAEEKTEAKLTLGEYKGIKVDASLETVTQEDLDEYLQSVLKSKQTEEEVTGITFAKDDVAKLDYTCTVDGKEYKSGTGSKVTLNDEGFVVDGFVEGIIGKKTGDEFTLELKFDDKYTDSTVAGKAATFKVKLIAKVNTITPEFTDEFVSKNFDYLKLATKQDLLDYLKHDLIINQVYSDIWEKVIIGKSTAESYDSDDLAEMTKEYSDYQEYYIYQMTGGMTLDDYLSAVGQSKEDFTKSMEDMAKVYLKQEMVVKAIAEAENIVITDEIYQSEMLEFAKSYGFDTVAEFEEEYKDSMTKEDFEYTITTYLVQELVCESVEFVEGQGLYNPPEPETTTGGAEATTGANETTTGEAETTSAAVK